MASTLSTALAENNGKEYTTDITSRQYKLIADEPVPLGGLDKGPSPGEYLCMALASCQAITLRMYSERKGWKIESIQVKVDFVKGSEVPSGNNTFLCTIELIGSVTVVQQARLKEIAKVCPVHRLLSKPSDIHTTMTVKEAAI